MMRRRFAEKPRMGGFHTSDAINGAEDLDMLEYALDAALTPRDFSCYTELGRRACDQFGSEGAVSVQWCMQPYEMLGYPSTVTTAALPYDDESRFIQLMDKILRLDYKILDALAPSGVDFVFLGGPGSEMISPAYYEKYLVPYSRRVTDRARENGLLMTGGSNFHGMYSVAPCQIGTAVTPDEHINALLKYTAIAKSA